MKQQNNLSTMYDFLAEALKPYNAMMELSDIWTNKIRFAAGDEISIDDKGNPVKLTVRPTHKILSCWGKLNDTAHEMKVKNLETGELSTITL